MSYAARAALGAIAICCAGSAAQAGGFNLKEASASALGAAFSGATAGANDLTYSYWNPAALKSVEDFAIGGAVSTIFLQADGSVISGPNAGAALSAAGTDPGVVPAFYLGFRLDERAVIGISATAPFGLLTKYDRFSIPNTGQALKTELELIQFAPMIAYDVTPSLTIGGGPTVVTGTLVFETDVPAPLQNSKLDVNDTAAGFQIGALWQATPATSIGLSYHSGYDLEADGENVTAIASFPATFSADLPALATFGITHQLTERWRVQGEVQWQDWSALDVAQIETTGVGATGEPFHYDDAWYFAVGAEYAATDAWTLRGGVGYDQTPTTDDARSIRVPDQDRVWLALGASLAVADNATLDVGYAYLYVPDEAIAVRSAGAGDLNTVEYDDMGAQIISVGGTIDF